MHALADASPDAEGVVVAQGEVGLAGGLGGCVEVGCVARWVEGPGAGEVLFVVVEGPVRL